MPDSGVRRLIFSTEHTAKKEKRKRYGHPQAKTSQKTSDKITMEPRKKYT